MANIWKSISNLGIINDDSHSLENRTIILTNQLNAITLLLFFIIVIATRIDGYITDTPVGMGTYRSLFMIVLGCIVIILAYFNKTKLSRIFIIFLSPFLLIIVPTLFGFIEEESFVYYPYALITLSIYPQLLIRPCKEMTLFIIALVYYLILIVSTDIFLFKLGTGSFEIIDVLNKFYYWYKIIPIALFFFTAYSIYYLRSINNSFENEIEKNNKKLDFQNETLKSTIQELNKTQAKLIHSEKMAALGNLTTGISHEINNPLNYIAGGSFIISEELEDAKEKGDTITVENLKKAHDMIELGVSKATKVVQLLSVFSENTIKTKEHYSIDNLIEGTLCFLGVKINGKIEILKDYQYLSEVYVFQDQIHKTFLSIFENSIEAIFERSENGQIKIKTLKDVNKVIIEIWNSGSAIEESNLHRVFNPFFTTKIHKMNSGLGLTVAYNTIKNHDGDILISNQNDGVLVRVELPIK